MNASYKDVISISRADHIVQCWMVKKDTDKEIFYICGAVLGEIRRNMDSFDAKNDDAMY